MIGCIVVQGFRRIRWVGVVAGLAGAAPLAAHPHEFITAGLVFKTNAEGELTAIDVQWRYDELYTLELLTDLGLDPDFDGVLTDAELAELAGFDLNWMEGFDGDIHVFANGEPLNLGAPEFRNIAVEEGRIVTVHTRPVAAQVGRVDVRVFDETFYVYYDLDDGVATEAGCSANVIEADLDMAQSRLHDMIWSDPNIGEDNFPKVGAWFADMIEVTCGISS